MQRHYEGSQEHAMVRGAQQWRRHSFFRKAPLGGVHAQLGLPDGAHVTCAHLVELKARTDEAALSMQDVDAATTKILKEEVLVKALVIIGDDGGRLVVCDGHLTSPCFLPPFDAKALHCAAVPRGSPKDVAKCGAVVAAVGAAKDDSYLLRTFAVSDDGAYAGGVAELALSLEDDAPASLALREDGRLCAVGLENGSVMLISVGASVACSEDDLSRAPVVAGDKPRLVDFADAAARRIGRQLQTDKADELLQVCAYIMPPRGAPVVSLAFASTGHLFVGTQVRRFANDDVENDDADDDDAGGQVCCALIPEVCRGTLACHVLDEAGCGPGLMAHDGEKLVVARTDGLYLYSTEDRRGALGFAGPKTALACLGDGLVAVAAVGNQNRSEVTIYDIVQRRVVHFARLPQGVASCALLAALAIRPPTPKDYVDGRRPLMKPLASVLMLATDSSIVRYDEKSTPEKLDGLYKSREYASAVSVALKAGLPKRAAAQIFRMYGDHLCDQSSYSEAAEQYAHTMGSVAPSYVIQRFLNAHRFEELAIYLLRAHAREKTLDQFLLDDAYGMPRPRDELDSLKTRPELTTLLINCYAKLKDVEALDKFVANKDLAVDGATAVLALRDAGYYEHALQASVVFEEWAWRCLLSLERDPWRPEDALDHFDKMDLLSRFRCIRRFGIRLVKDYPDRTTELLMRLATAPDLEVDDCIRPEDLENPPVCFDEELKLRKDALRDKKRPKTPQAFPPDSESDDEGFTCDDFPHFFIHRPGHLRLFCDYVMHFDSRGRTKNMATTLVELLVDEWRALKDEGKDLEAKSEDIMALLKSDAPYDRMVALVLVETREFPPGVLYLYETKFANPPKPYTERREPWWTRRQKRRSKSFREAHERPGGPEPGPSVIPRSLRNGILLQEYHKRGRIGDMLRICRSEGRADPLLWVLATTMTAGAVPPEVVKRKRYFELGDDTSEVWDPEAAKEADEHTARCAQAGYEGENSEYAKEYAPPPPPPEAPITDPDILRKLDEREDKCSDLQEVLKALDEEKGLHPNRVVELCAQSEDVPLGAVLPYLQTVLGRWHAQTEAELKECRKLERECEGMRRELHDRKVAEVRALPAFESGAFDALLKMEPGPEKTLLLDRILEEKYEVDMAAAQRAREDEGLPPLTEEDREEMLNKIKSDKDKKWLQIHKKRHEPVDHEQFFRELDDPDTGGFDCVARWLGKGIIQDHGPVGDALDAYPYLKPSTVGDEVAKDADRYLINVAPALRPYVQEPVPRATGTVELGAEEAKGA